MTISAKDKELAAVGISVAAGCKPCTDHHVTVARKARATDEEIRAAIAEALAVRGRAAEIMRAYALSHFGATASPDVAEDTGESRVGALIRVGAAFAVNCTASLEHALAAARRAGIAPDEVAEIVKLAGFIRSRAISHVEKLVDIGAAADP
ncbi:MAG: carboxymuconolactone decarboxylase family protein [Rhodospirillales bacterium]|nr:MAG: carboxymuconolactone decarboxylase family protein [Rhodospirillales bacterium]